MDIQFDEDVYQNRNNLHSWQLFEDAVALDSAEVTDVILEVNGVCYDLTDPNITLAPNGILNMYLGLLGLPDGKHEAKITIVTATQPEGIAFTRVRLHMKDWIICTD